MNNMIRQRHLRDGFLKVQGTSTFAIRLAVIFQNPARNNFWEAGIVMQSYMLDTVQ